MGRAKSFSNVACRSCAMFRPPKRRLRPCSIRTTLPRHWYRVWNSPTRPMVRTFRAGIHVSFCRRVRSVPVDDHPVDAFDWLSAVRTSRFESKNRRRGDMHVQQPEMERSVGRPFRAKCSRNVVLCEEGRFLGRNGARTKPRIDRTTRSRSRSNWRTLKRSRPCSPE